MEGGGGGVGTGRQGVLFCKSSQKPTETSAVADEQSNTLHHILSRNHLCYPPWQHPQSHPTPLDNVRRWCESCHIKER